MPEFDDATIERLLGAEDAENEDPARFQEYFFFNRTYDNLVADLPIRILVGHKGIGKSALLRRAYLRNCEAQDLAIWLKPNDLASQLAVGEETPPNQLIAGWKTALLRAIVNEALSCLAIGKHHRADRSTVYATALAAVDAITTAVTRFLKTNSAHVQGDLVTQYLKNRRVYIYIDDIDRGWTASRGGSRNIAALLHALRDLAGSEKRLMFRIGLRTDVYYLVRTADESTDKIERHIIWLSWTQHEILSMIARRIETFFQHNYPQDRILKMPQTDISRNILSKIMTPIFYARGHWSEQPIHKVLLSVTRPRPRDLLKLLHGAARRAYIDKHDTITTADLESTFEAYSTERLQDIINEFRSEMPNIEHLLLHMRPATKQRRTAASFLYGTGELTAKLKNLAVDSAVYFTNGKAVTAASLIQFLYKIDFIVARKDSPDHIDRRYFDRNRFLANEVVDFGYNWEVHPAYRWALQPYDVAEVLSQIRV